MRSILICAALMLTGAPEWSTGSRVEAQVFYYGAGSPYQPGFAGIGPVYGGAGGYYGYPNYSISIPYSYQYQYGYQPYGFQPQSYHYQSYYFGHPWSYYQDWNYGVPR